MKNNCLLRNDNNIIRILDQQPDKKLIIDCIKQTMPKWVKAENISSFLPCTEQELFSITNKNIKSMESFDADSRKFIHAHFSLIAGILPFIADNAKRNQMIENISEEMHVSKQTIRHYLCLYLVYQDISVLAPKQKKEKELSKDEKNMRWALNKFFYTRNKNSLQTAYTLMLKQKYCDVNGELLQKYPTFNQFRYFYRQTKSMQTYYISRDGLKNYQRNNRPLTGDGVQQFAPNVGVGMLDATICDIYLVDDAGNLVGRPVLTTCIDAYSSLCCGYSLTWEGGMYSLRNLMINVVTDKVEWCKKHGIIIDKSEWNNSQLPGVLVTDMGSEYKSENFEQLAELGVTITNLPPYRPELKGSVEKFFDLVQGCYKKHLKGKGVINPDFRERGSHDYRKDACLTIRDFERVILHCIIFYNSQRIIENFPYTDQMIAENVLPYANSIFEWGKNQPGANMISVKKNEIIYSLLPRTIGKFTRYGLKVNKMRYHCDGYTEEYLSGGEINVAYNPDDVTTVWALIGGQYVAFDLVERRYNGKNVEEAQILRDSQKTLILGENRKSTQAQIDLARYIETIANNVCHKSDVKVKDIRQTRKHETQRVHIDFDHYFWKEYILFVQNNIYIILILCR